VLRPVRATPCLCLRQYFGDFRVIRERIKTRRNSMYQQSARFTKYLRMVNKVEYINVGKTYAKLRIYPTILCKSGPRFTVSPTPSITVRGHQMNRMTIAHCLTGE